MRPDPTILAFDTSVAHCAAALLKDDAILAERIDLMARGQAEHLLPMIMAMLKSQNTELSDLDALAVGIGPGNFTGIRISVSAARGLALALGIPAIGVSMFEVMRLTDGEKFSSRPAEIVSLQGPRDSTYVQHFRYGKPQSPPRQINADDAPQDLRLPANMVVTGYCADTIAQQFGAEPVVDELRDIPGRIARIAAWRCTSQNEPVSRPVPLYVRPADAAPPRHKAPLILA